MATFTTRNPWTQGADQLAATIGAILDARNQRALQEYEIKQKQQLTERQKLSDIASVWENTADPSLRGQYMAQAEKLGLKQPERIGMGVTPQITTQIPTGPDTVETLTKKYIEQGYHPRQAQHFADKDIAKSSLGDAGLMARFTDLPGPDGKTHRYGFNPKTGNFDRDFGPIPEEKFKYTGASVFKGEDGRWWRWDPATGDAQFLGAGNKWMKDPNIPVPDAVTKELGRPPASTMEKGVTLDQIAGNLGRIKQNFNPEWVGPVAGRAYRFQEAVTGLKDDNQSAFYADVNDIGDMLLRARSGAQINESEYARLRRLVPTPDLPPKVFNERMNRFEKQFTQAIESWERRLSGGRYMVPERAPQTKAVTNRANNPNEMQIGGFKVRVKQ